MDEQEIFYWIENKTFSKLSDLQKEILKGSWEGKSYQSIANSYNYNLQYVKDVGYRLWHSLTENCDERITKKNFPVKIEKIINASVNTVNNHQDWGDAPDVPIFFGRNQELQQLEQWISQDYCRLIGIIGMGGIGKTKIAVTLGKRNINNHNKSPQLILGIEDRFEYVIWRSLLNPLPITDFLTDLIGFVINKQQTEIPECLEAQISQLLYFFQQHRCLLILDNVETILQANGYAGQYCEEYQGYSQFLTQVATVRHQSCVVFTSREKPYNLDRMSGINHPLRLLELGGLDYHEGKEIFQAIGNFAGTEGEWQTLIEFYNGNPLILELVAHHIRAVFGGDIRQFLVEGKYIFDDLQILLNRHLERLSSAEQEIIDCLATNWQPVSLAELKVKLRSLDTKKRITDILQSLTRRLIINTSVMGYTLQPMLREYINYEKNSRLIVTSTKVVSIKTKC